MLRSLSLISNVVTRIGLCRNIAFISIETIFFSEFRKVLMNGESNEKTRVNILQTDKVLMFSQ